MGRKTVATAALVWLAAFAVSISTYRLYDDHFGRISPARQIAMYGELPFRDFLDPGYFLAEMTSALLQRLLGDNLLGELLLTTVAIATGSLFVLLLAARISGSLAAGAAAAVLAVSSMPRAYDYDKCFFFPLGILLCWRYLDRNTPRRLWALAAGLVVGALFRYDTGAYIGAAAIAAIAIAHAKEPATLTRRFALFAGAVACLSLPYLAYLHASGGVDNAVDQMWTYARREVARTRVTSLPRLSRPDTTPPPVTIRIRWAPSAGDEARAQAEQRHALLGGVHQNTADGRTWLYRLTATPATALRAIVNDPSVEDTDGIDRSTLALYEPLWTRAQRTFPTSLLQMLPGPWNADNAGAVLHYLLWAVPAIAAGVLFLVLRFASPGAREEAARVGIVIVVAIALDVFVVRDPVAARVGGVAAPSAVIGAWLCRKAWHARPRIARGLLRPAVVVAVGVVAWSLSASDEWSERLAWADSSPQRMWQSIRRTAVSPPDLGLLPDSGHTGLVAYLRECTQPADRVFVSWFAPEISFFAQRGFAGGIAAVFGGHWSEPRFERTSIDRLQAQSVPIVVIQAGEYANLRGQYPMLDGHFMARYRVAGETNFGRSASDTRSYMVLVDRDKVPLRTHAQFSLPCFA
jgi:hypothetical protein